MFELSVDTQFCAAHHLRGYDGKCSQIHGHTWGISVSVRGDRQNEIGMLVDFKSVRTAVQSVLEELDHTNLNEHKAFAEENPTSENIATFLYEKLSADLNCDSYRVSKICVREGPGSAATYWEDN